MRLLVIALLMLSVPSSAVAAQIPAPALPEAPVEEGSPWRVTGYQYLAGVGATAITVPMTFLLAQEIGASTPDLIGAAVPSLLLMLALPPLAAALAEWAVGRALAPGTRRFHPAVWAGVGLHAIGILAGALAGVWTGNATSFSLFTVAEALVVPAVVALVMHVKRRPAPTRPAGLAPPSTTSAPERRPFADAPRAGGLPPPSLVVPVAAFTF